VPHFMPIRAAANSPLPTDVDASNASLPEAISSEPSSSSSVYASCTAMPYLTRRQSSGLIAAVSDASSAGFESITPAPQLTLQPSLPALSAASIFLTPKISITGHSGHRGEGVGHQAVSTYSVERIY
jgi:hypothetical protein